MLYCTQPLLPVFSAEFGVTPAVASLSLSVATGTLAVALILAGSFSEAWGRVPMMTLSLALSSFLMVLVALSPGFAALLVLRAVQGVALAGLPAVAMAYLAEEVHPEHAGFTVGLYIAGNSVGGLAGRILSGVLTDAFSWRLALGSPSRLRARELRLLAHTPLRRASGRARSSPGTSSPRSAATSRTGTF